ncbi:MAG: 2-oxoglutarate and iron-dependent oxygenase domain-containing protein [Pseudomonadota bacterium]
MTISSDAAQLPVIDLSLPDEDAWRTHLAAQIDWAASEFGFFYVIGHGIDQDLTDSLFALSRRFFAQDTAAKNRIHMQCGGRAWRGYFPVGGELTSGRADLKEGIYFGEELAADDARVRAGLPLHGSNQFPELPGFRDTALNYMSALKGLGHRLMASIGRGLHLGDEYFDERYTDKPTTLFRIFNYPPSAPGFDGAGVGEHTDYGLLTMLVQDEVGGLQVKYKEAWLEVPFVPGSFVCNVGDMLERLTGGRYQSALHRVINRSRRERVSMPFFFDPRFEAELHEIPGIRPASRARIERWDGLELAQLQGTYGDYLIGKVSKVFPELGGEHLRRETPARTAAV